MPETPEQISYIKIGNNEHPIDAITLEGKTKNDFCSLQEVLQILTDYQRKPVVIWETDSTGLFAIGSNISTSPSWQLTNLDFSPFKRVKIYTKCSQKNNATPSASTTSAMILEMSLDSRAAGPYAGHFVGSVVSQNPNDANRLSTLTCAISADKTSFVVLRMTTLYGTAATDNTDANGYVFKIEGYYD